MNAERGIPNVQPIPQPITRKPFPIVQLSIIWLIQLTEPISSTVIYPFVNQFVSETGITHGNATITGYYTGIIESVFFLAECLSVYHWGRLSDKIGRRPVLLLAPLGLALAILVFGLSHNFWVLVLARCVQGVFNGNVGIGKSVMIEITDPADVPIAFGWNPAVWSIGITLGPIIGGTFARPAIRWPDSFGRFTFFHDFPYFLPCAVASAIAFGTFLYAYVLLQESLLCAIKQDSRAERLSSSMQCEDTDATAPLLYPAESGARYGTSELVIENHMNPADLKPLPFRSLLTPRLLIALASVGFIAFIDQSFGVLFPLMLSTSISLGGLGFDPYIIGMTMGTWGLLNAVFQVVMFPRLFHWLGPHRLCVFCFGCSAATFLVFPFTSIFAKQTGTVDYRVWVLLAFQLVSFSFVFLTYSCTQLFVLDAVPGRASIGAVIGLSQMTGSIVRTLAPTFASSLFSLSIQKRLIGGYFVYAVLVMISLSSMAMATLLPHNLRDQKQ